MMGTLVYAEAFWRHDAVGFATPKPEAARAAGVVR